MPILKRIGSTGVWTIFAIASICATSVGAQIQGPPYPSIFDQTASERMGPQNEAVDAGKYQRVLYVSAAGSDDKGDGSKEQPWATPAGALAKITDASQDNLHAVFVSAGSYPVKDMQLKEHVHLYGGFD